MNVCVIEREKEGESERERERDEMRWRASMIMETISSFVTEPSRCYFHLALNTER